MKRFVSLVCAATIAAGAAFTAAPAMAAPISPLPKAETAGAVVDVQYRRGGGYYERGGYGYYNGHRGSREYRRGYRRHGDYWFPAAAFLGAAIIGGMLADQGPRYYEPEPEYEYQPRVVRRAGSSHVQWCYDRYRSYRAYDNTFQPYEGPRQQCYSPYN